MEIFGDYVKGGLPYTSLVSFFFLFKERSLFAAYGIYFFSRGM